MRIYNSTFLRVCKAIIRSNKRKMWEYVVVFLTNKKRIVFFRQMEYDIAKQCRGDVAMICSVHTMSVTGIQGTLVTVECYISNGLPAFDVVGLPDAAVKEARERVRAAAKTSGMRFPTGRITVNLAPANLKKTGTHFDLSILIGLMSASGAIHRPPSRVSW